MWKVAVFAMVVFAVTCGPSPDAKLPGYSDNQGGSVVPGSGGVTESGGSVGAGGAVSSGGRSAIGSGGRTGFGGASSAGGRVSGGSRAGGSTSSGGRIGTGGAISSGGVTAIGGIVGRGGNGGNGGNAGSGGIAGNAGSTGADAKPADTSSLPSRDGGNCLSGVVANGYACGSAPACSACKDNDTSLEAKCKAVLDCFAAKYPCTANCATECLNSAGASGPVQACVTALQTAACTGGGC